MDDSTSRELLDTFMKRAEELGLNLADCRGQSYYSLMVLIRKAKKQASKPDFWKSIQKLCRRQPLIEFSSCGLRQIFN